MKFEVPGAKYETHPRFGFRARDAGFTLVETVIACALLLLVSTALLGGVAFGYQTRAASAIRGRAVLRAAEGIEAARNIRDNAFSNLVNGTFGLATSSSKWIFSGSSDSSGGFTRTVTISTVDSVTKQVVSRVSWTGSVFATGSTSVTAYLSNLALLYQQANSLAVNTAGAVLAASSTQLAGITLQDSGPRAISIIKFKPSWSGANKIKTIVIGGTTVWSSTGPGTPTGTQVSGTLLTISTTTLIVGAAASTASLTFTGAMTLTGYTFEFTMSDNTTKTVTI